MQSVILLGAGASRGTLGECAPISKEFCKQVTAIPKWTEEYPYLAAAIQFLSQRITDCSLESWALDKLWGAMATRDRLKQILVDSPSVPQPPPYWDFWGVASFELSCLVARLYGESLEPEIQKSTKQSGHVKVEIQKLKAGDCIISFNYDLLAERILDDLKKEWIRAIPWKNPDMQPASVLLCKPHGSLDWKGYFPEYGHPIEFLGGSMKEREITPQCHPCLIAPIPFKSEIIDGALQTNLAPNLFRLLVAQWRFAIEYISKADKLVVMGYGFPSEDLHAHYFFAEAAAKRGKKALQVEVFETCMQRFCEVKVEIAKIFGPSGCEISFYYKGQVES